jgi:hypothetical protein
MLRHISVSLMAFLVWHAPVDAQFTARPTINVNGSGIIPTESDYVPNVVHCENGLASFEALKAQAVAARTFAYYKMNLQGFINDGTGDQVYSCGGSPSALDIAAAAATEGEILFIEDNIGPSIGEVLIASFYVAGAIPSGPFDPSHPSAIPNAFDPDPTSTQQWVTYPYEAGLFGGNNLGTPLGFQGSPSNPNWPNRGAKSQNGADFLSDNSIHYVDILKYYYGADIQLRTATTVGTNVEFGPKILTTFDDYGERFGSTKEGHEGYFHRDLDFSGSTTANVTGSTAERTSAEAQSGSDSQLLNIAYDESSGTEFLIRHLAAARFSDFDGSVHAGERVSNLQFESIGSVGFWLKTDDPGLQVTVAIDDPTTGDRGVFKPVVADNQWHRYQWYLEQDSQWEAWPGVGGNGQIDGDRVTLDSIQLIGSTDAQVYLDSIFWEPVVEVPNGDFDGNGQYTCNDVNLLTAEIASGNFNGQFDLNIDGVLDTADLDAWLAEAGAANLPSGNAYLPADVNLDGFVDGQDFVRWNDNKFSSTDAFCLGDFNADGSVDGQDFIIWNTHKFTGSNDTIHAVPEPASAIVLAIGVLLTAAVVRRSRDGTGSAAW